MIEAAEIRDLLAREWNLHNTEVTVHDGGMNSSTWWVTFDDRRWVAKSVPADARSSFEGGLAVATRLQRAGIATGAPVPTLDGRSVTTIAGQPFALLEHVPGDGLTEADQTAIGTVLGRVHLALLEDLGNAERFHWVDAHAPHLDVRDWVRPAVTAALADLDALDAATLTWGMLHTDPAPEAFLRATDGSIGLIDWSVAMYGPLLYDLASAVMYVGGISCGHALVEAYLGVEADLGVGALDRAEVERGLATMLRFRWAVQADYFARRLTANDLTGIDDATGNEKGLTDARRALAAM